MYKNSTKSLRKAYTFTWEYQEGRYGYEPNSSIVDCVCDTTLLFLWCPVFARPDWLAGCYLQCDWLRPGRARRQGSAEDGALHLRSQRHNCTNKVPRVRDIFDFQCWLCYDSSLSDNICTSVWPFKFVEWLWLVLIFYHWQLLVTLLNTLLYAVLKSFVNCLHLILNCAK